MAVAAGGEVKVISRRARGGDRDLACSCACTFSLLKVRGCSCAFGLMHRMKKQSDAARCVASSVSCAWNLATTPMNLPRPPPPFLDGPLPSSPMSAATNWLGELRSSTSRSSGQRSLFLSTKPAPS